MRSTRMRRVRRRLGELLTVHAYDKIADRDEDDELDRRRGLELRHEGDSIRCWRWKLTGRNCCGVEVRRQVGRGQDT